MHMRIEHLLICATVLLGIISCKSRKAVTMESREIIRPEESAVSDNPPVFVVDQDGNPIDLENILISFEQEDVHKDEFERVYAKNNGGPEVAATHSKAQLEEYLDLYINFKRKVFEAEAKGLDTTAAFKQEFNTYKKQLVQPYLSAKEVEDQLIQEAYDRSGYMVNASHLLLMVQENASPEDTLLAYNKLVGYRDSIVDHGVSFEDMAQKYSEDPSARENAGLLGYFTAFDMVYPFESAAFSTEPGKVSMPIRTQFGYHLVKVNDKVSRAGTKTAAHIIVRIGDRYGAKTEEQAISIIQEIHQKLKEGEDFGKLAEQYSDDPNSASKGGDLGSGRLLPEMENLKHKLGEGEFSEPFQTRFGWHILAITEIEKREPFEEAKYALKQKISRDSRSQISQDALITRIKKESGFQFNQENFDAFAGTLNENFQRGIWTPDTSQAELYAKPLFVLQNGGLTKSVDDFIQYYRRTRARKPQLSTAAAARSIADDYIKQELLAYEESQLPIKNPEFRHLLREYRDGILLFTLMEQKVWKKAVEDTTGLKNFYTNNQQDFHKEDMLEVKEYRSSDRAILEQVSGWLKEGWTDERIDSVMREGSALQLRVIRQSLEKGKAEVEESLFSEEVGHRSDIMSGEDFFRIIEIEEKRPAGIPPFDKVKSEAITRYQDFLEKEWLAELEEKYPVQVDIDVFESLFK